MELREWQYINKPAGSTTNNSSSGYKKRFEKLIKYHIDHASSELESVTTKDISNWHFRLGEHYNTGSDEFDRDIAVSVDKATGTFYLNIFVDGKQVYHNDYESYEEVLEILTGSYMFLPDEGTQEYNDLLTESLKEWKAMNSPKASQPTSSSTNKDKFVKLMYNMMKDKLPSVTDVKCVRVDDNGFTYKETRNNVTLGEHVLTLLVGYNKDDSWKYELYIDTTLAEARQGNSMKELLRWLSSYFSVPLPGSKEYSELCESYTIADDFKLYENLWD